MLFLIYSLRKLSSSDEREGVSRMTMLKDTGILPDLQGVCLGYKGFSKLYLTSANIVASLQGLFNLCYLQYLCYFKKAFLSKMVSYKLHQFLVECNSKIAT